MTNVKASLNLSTPVTVLAPAALTPKKCHFSRPKIFSQRGEISGLFLQRNSINKWALPYFIYLRLLPKNVLKKVLGRRSSPTTFQRWFSSLTYTHGCFQPLYLSGSSMSLVKALNKEFGQKSRAINPCPCNRLVHLSRSEILKRIFSAKVEFPFSKTYM